MFCSIPIARSNLLDNALASSVARFIAYRSKKQMVFFHGYSKSISCLQEALATAQTAELTVRKYPGSRRLC